MEEGRGAGVSLQGLSSGVPWGGVGGDGERAGAARGGPTLTSATASLHDPR